MDKALFNRIIQQLLPDMGDADERKALIESALYGSPVLDRINWSGASRGFTVRLVRTLEDFGEIEAGKPAIVALLEDLREQVGDDRQKQIDDILSQFSAPAPLPDITQPDKTFADDELYVFISYARPQQPIAGRCQVICTWTKLWHDREMKIPDELFKNHRFPAEIIQYGVWLYFVFPLSFRDVELLLHQRGIVVSHEAIRSWCYKFGLHFAQQVRKKRRPPTDKWHLDEVFVTINGQRYYLWRAVDSEGLVLDILMQTRRNAKAARRFFEGVLGKTSCLPRVIVTDGLRSYNVISRELLPDVEHRRSKYLNNRAENSHQPTRRRERRMQRFKSPYQAQLFLSIFDVLYRYFHPKKHALQTAAYRHQLDSRFSVWSQLAA